MTTHTLPTSPPVGRAEDVASGFLAAYDFRPLPDGPILSATNGGGVYDPVGYWSAHLADGAGPYVQEATITDGVWRLQPGTPRISTSILATDLSTPYPIVDGVAVVVGFSFAGYLDNTDPADLGEAADPVDPVAGGAGFMHAAEFVNGMEGLGYTAWVRTYDDEGTANSVGVLFRTDSGGMPTVLDSFDFGRVLTDGDRIEVAVEPGTATNHVSYLLNGRVMAYATDDTYVASELGAGAVAQRGANTDTVGTWRSGVRAMWMRAATTLGPVEARLAALEV